MSLPLVATEESAASPEQRLQAAVGRCLLLQVSRLWRLLLSLLLPLRRWSAVGAASAKAAEAEAAEPVSGERLLLGPTP